MLQFPENYFEREVRSGHMVGELMKRAWASQLNILNVIDGICKKHDLTYFAYWGTLIGAVRHQGFIPWDDDLDIAFPRPDYVKFLGILEDELPKDYHLINNYVSEWDNNFSRITNASSIFLSGRELEENYMCPFSLGIDIFPLDYISRDSREAEEQRKILYFIGILQTALKERKEAEHNGASETLLAQYSNSIASSLVTLEKMCGVRFEGNVSLSKQLNILYDQISALFSEEESDYIADFPAFFRYNYIVKKEWFNEIIRVPFENTEIPIPIGYHSILTRSYADYMIPVKGGGTHGELYFRGQIEILANELDLRSKKILSKEEEMKFLNTVQSLSEFRGKKRKIIFFTNSTLETIAHDAYVVKKINAVIEEFKNRPDYLLWWRPARLDSDKMNVLRKSMPCLVQEYCDLIVSFGELKNGILDEGIGIAHALEYCDAYYGDEGNISKLFELKSKPVMITNYRV